MRTTKEAVFKEYFEWIYQLVCDDLYGLSYYSLLSYLFSVNFAWINDKDANRAFNGKALRRVFAREVGYTQSEIDIYFQDFECSVLEMMVALSIDMEGIMNDTNLGNRTAQWFWGMIGSLGLGQMDDDGFDMTSAHEALYIFMNRLYRPNGEGGLFTLRKPYIDLRNVEIWMQAMWFLNEHSSY